MAKHSPFTAAHVFAHFTRAFAPLVVISPHRFSSRSQTFWFFLSSAHTVTPQVSHVSWHLSCTFVLLRHLPWSSFFWQYLAFFVSAHGVDGDGGGDGGDGGSNAGGDGGQGQSKTSVLALHDPDPPLPPPRHSHRE